MADADELIVRGRFDPSDIERGASRGAESIDRFGGRVGAALRAGVPDATQLAAALHTLGIKARALSAERIEVLNPGDLSQARDILRGFGSDIQVVEQQIRSLARAGSGANAGAASAARDVVGGLAADLQALGQLTRGARGADPADVEVLRQYEAELRATASATGQAAAQAERLDAVTAAIDRRASQAAQAQRQLGEELASQYSRRVERAEALARAEADAYAIEDAAQRQAGATLAAQYSQRITQQRRLTAAHAEAIAEDARLTQAQIRNQEALGAAQLRQIEFERRVAAAHAEAIVMNERMGQSVGLLGVSASKWSGAATAIAFGMAEIARGADDGARGASKLETGLHAVVRAATALSFAFGPEIGLPVLAASTLVETLFQNLNARRKAEEDFTAAGNQRVLDDMRAQNATADALGQARIASEQALYSRGLTNLRAVNAARLREMQAAADREIEVLETRKEQLLTTIPAGETLAQSTLRIGEANRVDEQIRGIRARTAAQTTALLDQERQEREALTRSALEGMARLEEAQGRASRARQGLIAIEAGDYERRLQQSGLFSQSMAAQAAAAYGDLLRRAQAAADVALIAAPRIATAALDRAAPEDVRARLAQGLDEAADAAAAALAKETDQFSATAIELREQARRIAEARASLVTPPTPAAFGLPFITTTTFGPKTPAGLDNIFQLPDRWADLTRIFDGVARDADHVARAFAELPGLADTLAGRLAVGVLRATAQGAGGLATIAGGVDRFGQAGAIAKLEGIAGIASGILGVGGAVAGLTQALFGETEAHRLNRLALEQNTATLRAARLAATGFNPESASAIASLQRALSGRDLATVEARIRANRGTGDREILESFLRPFGVSIEQAEAQAEKFGITLYTANGIVPGALSQLADRLGIAADAALHFGASLDDQRTRLDVRRQLEGLSTDPARAFADEIALARSFGGRFADQFATLDVTTQAGVAEARRRLLALFDAFDAGQLTLSDLGNLSGADFIDFLRNAGSDLDRLSDAATSAADQLSSLNVPAGFRVDAARFRATEFANLASLAPIDPGTLAIARPTDTTRPPLALDPAVRPTDTGATVVNHYHFDGPITVDARDKSAAQMFDEIQDEAERRAYATHGLDAPYARPSAFAR